VNGVTEAGCLHSSKRLGRSGTGLAVQHDRPVLRQLGQGPTGEDLVSLAPGIATISYSFGSRTSINSKSLPASIMSLSSSTVMVAPSAASDAASETTPQKSS
jgi:hypothetical protein